MWHKDGMARHQMCVEIIPTPLKMFSLKTFLNEGSVPVDWREANGLQIFVKVDRMIKVVTNVTNRSGLQ